MSAAAASTSSTSGSAGGKGPGSSWWDERYGEEEFAYGTEPNDFLKQTVEELGLKSGRCLMLADGEGRNGVFLAKQGMEVVSVDYSQAGLDKAQKLASDSSVKIETVLADLADYDFGKDQWDCIVSIYCHLPPPIRKKVQESVVTSLKPGGHYILEAYTPQQLEFKTGGPPVEVMMYSKQLLEEALSSEMDIQKNEETVRDVVEGKFHTGKGAVVQFIGTKKLP